MNLGQWLDLPIEPVSNSPWVGAGRRKIPIMSDAGFEPTTSRFNLLCLIFGKACQTARPLPQKQNIRFQVGICLEKCQLDQVLDQVKNGRLAAIIDFIMRNIWKPMPDS